MGWTSCLEDHQKRLDEADTKESSSQKRQVKILRGAYQDNTANQNKAPVCKAEMPGGQVGRRIVTLTSVGDAPYDMPVRSKCTNDRNGNVDFQQPLSVFYITNQATDLNRLLV